MPPSSDVVHIWVRYPVGCFIVMAPESSVNGCPLSGGMLGTSAADGPGV